MEVKLLSDDGNILRLAVRGDPLGRGFPPDFQPFTALLGPDGYTRRVLLSLVEPMSINTAGMSWLLVLQKRFRESGGRLVVHSLRPQVVEMLRFVRFEVVLDIAEDETAALELLRAGGP